MLMEYKGSNGEMGVFVKASEGLEAESFDVVKAKTDTFVGKDVVKKTILEVVQDPEKKANEVVTGVAGENVAGITTLWVVRRNPEKISKEVAKHVGGIMYANRDNPNVLQGEFTRAKWEYLKKAYGRKIGTGLGGGQSGMAA